MRLKIKNKLGSGRTLDLPFGRVYDTVGGQREFVVDIGIDEWIRYKEELEKLKKGGWIEYEVLDKIIEEKKVVDVTYEELKWLRDNKKLKEGEEYRITDFQMSYLLNHFDEIEEWDGGYNYPGSYESRPYVVRVGDVAYKSLRGDNVGNYPPESVGEWWEVVFQREFVTEVEPIIVKAVSNEELGVVGRSERYLFDEVYYSLDMTQLPNGFQFGGVQKGWIRRRVDRLRNVDMPIDWRNCKFLVFGASEPAMYRYSGMSREEGLCVRLERCGGTLYGNVVYNVYVSGEYWNNVILGGGINIISSMYDNYIAGYYEDRSCIIIRTGGLNGNFGYKVFGLVVDGDTFYDNRFSYLWRCYFNVGDVRNNDLRGMYYQTLMGGRVWNCNLEGVSNGILIFGDLRKEDLRMVGGKFVAANRKGIKTVRAGSYNMSVGDGLIRADASRGNVIINLVRTSKAREVEIKRLDTNVQKVVTIMPATGETIEGAGSYRLGVGEKVKLVAGVGAWYVV